MVWAMATRALSAAFFVVPRKPKLSYSSSNLKFAAGPPSGWGGCRGSLYSSYRVSIGNGCVKCKAAGESSNPRAVQVYQGVFGPWTVDPSDVREVTLYRSGLVTAAASFVIAASAAFLPDNSLLGDIIKQNLDIFYAVGAGGLGLSLLLIHIYVTPIKRTLQAFWALGVLGSLATYISLAQPAGENLVEYVLDNPKAVLFVGPLFAALTGLVFKEGLCYGKLEAGILTFIIPSVLLGHLVLLLKYATCSEPLLSLSLIQSLNKDLTDNLCWEGRSFITETGLMNDEVKVPLLGLWMTLFVIFAGRKFSQSIKDDIGDKSVFMFNALPEDQKNALVEKLRAEKVESEP
ncbi:uncharacterized protein LOC130778608 isoform X1 [Actinidia eriantha]|uniref:uncharacterized protein LOC130778608 isoform X1 n=1 Tax=Actinidia eriantha TaxID=165200 RepID=UPI00258BC1A0|nr:uncharacterized protein LOC130778608 isoform X1 [Actinidia eriantha]